MADFVFQSSSSSSWDINAADGATEDGAMPGGGIMPGGNATPDGGIMMGGGDIPGEAGAGISRADAVATVATVATARHNREKAEIVFLHGNTTEVFESYMHNS